MQNNTTVKNLIETNIFKGRNKMSYKEAARHHIPSSLIIIYAYPSNSYPEKWN